MNEKTEREIQLLNLNQPDQFIKKKKKAKQTWQIHILANLRRFAPKSEFCNSCFMTF